MNTNSLFVFVIVCVWIKQDTLWTEPVGFLSRTLRNLRNPDLIFDELGKMICVAFCSGLIFNTDYFDEYAMIKGQNVKRLF